MDLFSFTLFNRKILCKVVIYIRSYSDLSPRRSYNLQLLSAT